MVTKANTPQASGRVRLAALADASLSVCCTSLLTPLRKRAHYDRGRGLAQSSGIGRSLPSARPPTAARSRACTNFLGSCGYPIGRPRGRATEFVPKKGWPCIGRASRPRISRFVFSVETDGAMFVGLSRDCPDHDQTMQAHMRPTLLLILSRYVSNHARTTKRFETAKRRCAGAALAGHSAFLHLR
jgi:hypothetical protein